MVYKDPSDPRIAINSRRHYEKNKQQYKDRAKQAKERIRNYVRALKERPCTDCGRTYPYYVMHFDHLGDKEYTIAILVNYNNRGKIEREIKKCEIVCANCHAERTHRRGLVHRLE